MQTFKKWMKLSTTAEKKRLAKLAGVNFHHLYRIASGQHEATSELAARIEKASIKISNPKLPILWRFDISPVCAGCPYTPSCGKKKK